MEVVGVHEERSEEIVVVVANVEWKMLTGSVNKLCWH